MVGPCLTVERWLIRSVRSVCRYHSATLVHYRSLQLVMTLLAIGYINWADPDVFRLGRVLPMPNRFSFQPMLATTK